MPSWAIHLKVAKEVAKDMPEEDYQPFLLGNLLPDVNLGYFTHLVTILNFTEELIEETKK